MSSPVNLSTKCAFSRFLASDKGGGGAGSTASIAAACEHTPRRAMLPLIKAGLTAADCQSPWCIHSSHDRGMRFGCNSSSSRKERPDSGLALVPSRPPLALPRKPFRPQLRLGNDQQRSVLGVHGGGSGDALSHAGNPTPGCRTSHGRGEQNFQATASARAWPDAAQVVTATPVTISPASLAWEEPVENLLVPELMVQSCLGFAHLNICASLHCHWLTCCSVRRPRPNGRNHSPRGAWQAHGGSVQAIKQHRAKLERQSNALTAQRQTVKRKAASMLRALDDRYALHPLVGGLA